MSKMNCSVCQTYFTASPSSTTECPNCLTPYEAGIEKLEIHSADPSQIDYVGAPERYPQPRFLTGLGIDQGTTSLLVVGLIAFVAGLLIGVPLTRELIKSETKRVGKRVEARIKKRIKSR